MNIRQLFWWQPWVFLAVKGVCAHVKQQAHLHSHLFNIYFLCRKLRQIVHLTTYRSSTGDSFPRQALLVKVVVFCIQARHEKRAFQKDKLLQAVWVGFGDPEIIDSLHMIEIDPSFIIQRLFKLTTALNEGDLCLSISVPAITSVLAVRQSRFLMFTACFSQATSTEKLAGSQKLQLHEVFT